MGIILHTERLIIRDLIIDDLKDHHELISNDKVMYFLQDIKTNSVQESKENLLMAINDKNSNDRKYYFFLIEEKSTNEFIGEMGYTVTQNTDFGKLVHMGYFIKEKHWNKGYVTEALKRVIQFAFEEGGVYRISTGCLKDNYGSERVMQKCGYTKEAEFKEYVFHDGKLKDRLEYRLLKHEWARGRLHE
ncbi:MAG: GNAT family N-acetyltransferase [Treponema sp.]|nr:GNAT family N-acetyltransferase [Treponema sp.]